MQSRPEATENRVKTAREALGLSQVELASATQLSRQSIGAIESGRVTPSVEVALRLAAVLDRTVEELFTTETVLPSMMAEAASPALDGRIALAHIDGRWVAHGLSGQGTRTAADALGTKNRVNRAMRVELLRAPAEVRENVLVMGCAAGLGLLADRLNDGRGVGRFIWLSGSSTEALKALARGHTHIAGVHLQDGKTGDENLPDVRRIVSSAPVSLFTLGRWEMGLVTRPERSCRVTSLSDLARPDIRLCLREKGAGARRVFEQVLRKEGVPMALALTRSVQATGHFEVAQLVAAGASDVGVATRDAALAFGLRFMPLLEERFDLALREGSESDARIARLLEKMTASSFRRELSSLGYDVRQSGDRVAA